MFKVSEKKRATLLTEADFQFSRSSGPGGQKVNKTETRVELHWDLLSSPLFNGEQKKLLSEKLKNRLNKQGFIIFYSDKYRTREQNKDHCFRNLVTAIEKSLTKPKPRKKTKPTRSSVEKRLQEKKKQGDKKRMRKGWD